ncbi:MAG: hypothetical protein IPO79_17630 [Flavobacteriales bacterium]|nr:hypothetical protein [Flavobacteriales bacterium]MBK9701845.1 hypothetical protein [Flavobacteriales bacterium]
MTVFTATGYLMKYAVRPLIVSEEMNRHGATARTGRNVQNDQDATGIEEDADQVEHPRHHRRTGKAIYLR